MRKWSILFIMSVAVFCLMALGPRPAQAQQRASPHESTSITAGGHKITITYGRPYLHGRKMLGEHEPYGKVWRTGADEATTIETDADLEIAGLKVPKGKYALFTIPGKKKWKLIVDKTADQWGAFKYNQATDLGRVDMNVSESSQPVEQLTITLSPAGSDGVDLKLTWENTVATVPIKIL